MRMITGKVRKVKIVFIFVVLRVKCYLRCYQVLLFGSACAEGFDPERERGKGRKNKHVSDEQFALYIKRNAEKVSGYDSEQGKEAK